MEMAKGPPTSGKQKRRRTSPKKVVVTNVRSLANQPEKDNFEELPSAKDRRKSKRRSSMRRRSLVATLEFIHSNKAEKVEEKNEDIAVLENQSDNEKNLPIEASIPVKEPNHHNVDSVGEPPSNVEYAIANKSSQGEKSSPDYGFPSSEDPDAKYVHRLKAECDGWTEQLEKYKRLEKASPHFKCATSLNIENINAKYDFWDEQVSVLEETLAASITVVSRTMDRINELRTLHEVRVKKVSEDVFNNTVQERGGDDPRLLIKKIFMLHSMTPDR